MPKSKKSVASKQPPPTKDDKEYTITRPKHIKAPAAKSIIKRKPTPEKDKNEKQPPASRTTRSKRGLPLQSTKTNEKKTKLDKKSAPKVTQDDPQVTEMSVDEILKEKEAQLPQEQQTKEAVSPSKTRKQNQKVAFANINKEDLTTKDVEATTDLGLLGTVMPQSTLEDTFVDIVDTAKGLQSLTNSPAENTRSNKSSILYSRGKDLSHIRNLSKALQDAEEEEESEEEFEYSDDDNVSFKVQGNGDSDVDDDDNAADDSTENKKDKDVENDEEDDIGVDEPRVSDTESDLDTKPKAKTNQSKKSASKKTSKKPKQASQRKK